MSFDRVRRPGAIATATGCAVLLLGLAAWTATGQEGHEHHAPQAAASAPAAPTPPAAPTAQAGHRHDDHRMGSEFRIVRVFEPPQGFRGNLAVDRQSGRLWMMSFGPPANTRGPSVLYEADLETGRVLRSAQLPFEGQFGPPTFVDGALHQVIAHESKLYRISVDPETFGRIVGSVDLPTLDRIAHDGEVPLRFPFIGFRGMTATAEGKLLAHAPDLGELVEIDPATGRLERRVQTLRAVEGIAAARGERGQLFVLASSDPVKASFEYHVRRFMWRASHGTVPSVRHGKDAVYWVLLDGHSGEILTSLRQLDPRTHAASLALVDHRSVEGSRFGRFTFLTTGDEGVFTIEWTPGMRS